MSRFLSLIAVVIIIPVTAYVIFALSRPVSNDPVINLFGPGDTPTQCVARLRPHFEEMELAMTEIADALLASDDLVDIGPGYSWPDNETSFMINVWGGSPEYELTDAEIEFYRARYKSFPPYRYYGPERFRDEGDHVGVILNTECGIPALNWIGLQLGLDARNRQKPSTIGVGLVYRPSADFEPLECPEPIKDPNPVISCEFPLNENWAWVSLWTSPEAFEDFQQKRNNKP